MNHVLHIINRLDRERGSTTWLASMLISMNDPLIKHFVVSTSKLSGTRENEFITNGIDVIHIPLNFLNPIPHCISLYNLIKSKKIDIVQSHMGWLGAYDTLIALFAGIKSRIIYFHSGDWLHAGSILHRFGALFFTLLGRITATHFSAGSEDALKRWLPGHHLMPQRCIVVSSGIKFHDFSNFDLTAHRASMGIPDDALVVGHVGRLTPEKNHITILQACFQLLKQHSSMHLVIIGDGPEKNKLEAFCQENSIDNRVHFLGVRTDVRECMKAMDVFILPSLFESYGMVALEAQDAGTRLMASNITVLDTLVSPLWQNFRFDPEKPDEIISQFPLIMKMPKNRPDEFLEKHRLSDSIDKLAKFYRLLGTAEGKEG